MNNGVSTAADSPVERLRAIDNVTPGYDLAAALHGFVADVRGLDPVAREIAIQEASGILRKNKVRGAKMARTRCAYTVTEAGPPPVVPCTHV
jgi:hypothetical protein